jgi:hypothetical protein
VQGRGCSAAAVPAALALIATLHEPAWRTRANHLVRGRGRRAVYATVIAATGGYGTAFLVAAALAACGLAVVRLAPGVAELSGRAPRP